jgi:hypothetical protein
VQCAQPDDRSRHAGLRPDPLTGRPKGGKHNRHSIRAPTRRSTDDVGRQHHHHPDLPNWRLKQRVEHSDWPAGYQLEREDFRPCSATASRDRRDVNKLMRAGLDCCQAAIVQSLISPRSAHPCSSHTNRYSTCRVVGPLRARCRQPGVICRAKPCRGGSRHRRRNIRSGCGPSRSYTKRR